MLTVVVNIANTKHIISLLLPMSTEDQ